MPATWLSFPLPSKFKNAASILALILRSRYTIDMSISQGLSDYFPKFEEVDVEDLQKWLKVKDDRTILENRLGNRILYSQTIPQNQKDLLFDFVIIRKIIEQNQTRFYNKNLRRIDIPEAFYEYFPNLQHLAGAFIDAIAPCGITTFFIMSNQSGRKQIGTYIRPENLQASGLIIISIKNQQYQIKVGSLVIIPILESKIDITFTSMTAKLAGKKILATQIVGGQLGLVIDARIL